MELTVKVITTITRKREVGVSTETCNSEVKYIVPEDFPETESAKNMRMEFTSMICSLFSQDELGLD